MTGILAYDTEAFSFASDIVTAPGATYTVCTDLMGRDTVPSKTVPIGGGDNIYYLLVSNGQSQKLYTVLLRRGERTTVRLDLRDGSAPLSVYATVGLPITNLPSPTLRGFLFAGWYRDAACTQPFDETEPADNGMTLYAGWQIDPDARVSVTYYCKGQVWQTQQVPYGAFVTPPTPPQTEDDPFVGWYTADGHMADFSAPMVDDTEVTAVFASDMAVVYFYTDEGRLYGSTTVPKGMRVPVLPATVNGQAVTWCTADGQAFAPNTPIVADTDLYARTATVTYMIGENLYKTDIIPLYTRAVPPDDPALAGFVFVGWYVADTDTAFDFETPITKTTILYAKFDVATYTITYDLTNHANDVDGEGNSAVTNPNTVETYTVEKEVTFKRAFTSSMWCIWKDQDGNEVTSTKGLTKNLVLHAVWSKKPYINLDFEDAIIHYADNKGTEIAIDGTHQIYKNANGAAANPALYIMSEYKIDEATGYIVLDFSVPILMEAIKNTHNPMYIRNDKDAYGNYFCIILDHDLTDGSQNEKYYFDKNGEKDHAALDKTNNTYQYPGVYYYCVSGQHYDVTALCYLQNKDVTEQTVKLSFDFYFEEGGIFPISFYMRAGGNRTNLAALMPNGNISIGVDTVGDAGRLSYKDAEGNTIVTEQVLGTAKVGEWNHIEFVMAKNEAGTNYAVQILLNGDDITATGALNLDATNMTWGSASYANMFMIFGRGTAYAVDALDHDLVYKFDNIRLEGI